MRPNLLKLTTTEVRLEYTNAHPGGTYGTAGRRVPPHAARFNVPVPIYPFHGIPFFASVCLSVPLSGKKRRTDDERR